MTIPAETESAAQTEAEAEAQTEAEAQAEAQAEDTAAGEPEPADTVAPAEHVEPPAARDMAVRQRTSSGPTPPAATPPSSEDDSEDDVALFEDGLAVAAARAAAPPAAAPPPAPAAPAPEAPAVPELSAPAAKLDGTSSSSDDELTVAPAKTPQYESDAELDAQRARQNQAKRLQDMVGGSNGARKSSAQATVATESDDSDESSDSDSFVAYPRTASSTARSGRQPSEADSDSDTSQLSTTELQAKVNRLQGELNLTQAKRKHDKQQWQALHRQRAARDLASSQSAVDTLWTRDVPIHRQRQRALRQQLHRERAQIDERRAHLHQQESDLKHRREIAQKELEGIEAETEQLRQLAEKQRGDILREANEKWQAVKTREQQLEKEMEDLAASERRKTAEARTAAANEATKRVKIVDAQKQQLQEELVALRNQLVQKDQLTKTLQSKLNAEARSRRQTTHARRAQKDSHLQHLDRLSAVLKLQKIYRRNVQRRVMKQTHHAGAEQLASLRTRSKEVNAARTIRRFARQQKSRQLMKETHRAAGMQMQKLRAQEANERLAKEEIESLRKQVDEVEELREITPRLQRQLKRMERDHTTELSKLEQDHRLALDRADRQHQAELRKLENQYAGKLKRAEADAENRGRDDTRLQHGEQEGAAVAAALEKAKRQHHAELKKIEEKHARKLDRAEADAAAQYEAKQAAELDHIDTIAKLRQEHEKELRSLQEELQQAQETIDQLRTHEPAQVQSRQEPRDKSQPTRARSASPPPPRRAPPPPDSPAPAARSGHNRSPTPAVVAPSIHAPDLRSTQIDVLDVLKDSKHVRFTIQFVSGAREWRCSKRWSEMSSFNKQLKRARTPVKWPGNFPDKKTKVKTWSGDWDDKRLQSRKQELQTYWDEFANWANQLASEHSLNVFADLSQVQEFLAGAEGPTQGGDSPDGGADVDPDPVSFQLPGKLSELDEAGREELKENVRNLLPPGSVNRVELAGSIVVSVYFLAASADTAKQFLKMNVNKGKLKVRLGGQDLLAVALEEGNGVDDLSRMKSVNVTHPVGSTVEIFSQSQDRWVSGKVQDVDLQKSIVTVVYTGAQGKAMSKMVPLESPHLRAVPVGEGGGSYAAALTLSPEKATAAGDSGERLKRREGSSTQFAPTVLTGYWKATGRKADADGKGEKQTEFLKLEVDSTGVVTGLVDVNGDGVFNAEDCQIDNGKIDLDTGAFSLEQIWPPDPDDSDDEGETIYWSADYDFDKDRLVNGEWRDEDQNLTGTFSAKRDHEYAAELDGDERRVDARDGGAYTKREFVEHYGGEDEWQSSEPPTPLTKDGTPPLETKAAKTKKKKKTAATRY